MKYTNKYFNNLDNRIDFLQIFSDIIEKKFGSDFYLSVFGSFVRNDFKPGSSDIDMGLYCESAIKSFNLNIFLHDYITKNTELKLELVNISLTPYCWIYMNILTYGIPLTEYFPDFLAAYRQILRSQYRNWLPVYKRHLEIMNNRE